MSPSLLLLDEPFSSLDAETRTQMQALFKKVAAEFAITAIFVTHDLKEALLVGDVFASTRAGRFRAYATRQEFIDDPESGVRQEAGFWHSLERARP